MTKNRVCRVCYQPFAGKKGARTCSARCRKRLQRTREELGGGLMARRLSLGRLKALVLVGLGAIFMVGGGLGAQVLADIPTGYRTKDNSLTQNMAVTLTGEKEDGNLLVKAADSNESDYALGVVVGLDDSLIAASSVTPGVYVSSAGPVKVYVSDLNGAPEPGDLLSLSPLKGILMRSLDESKPSFGSALDNFEIIGSKPVKIKGQNGEVLSTNIALMNVNIDVNPPLKADSSSQGSWLQSFAAGLTGQQMSSFTVIAVLLIFITMMVVAGDVIFSAVSGSITAVGRNPLARSAITRQSLRSFALAGLVLAAGTVIILLLVWL